MRVAAAPLEAQRRADRMRNGAGHHGRRAHQADLGCGEVHRARLAARDAARAAVQLGEHGVEPAALGDVEAVRAVGREHQVVGPQAVAHADRDRLLADRQMDRALDPVGRIELDDPLLDQPDQQRRPEQPAIDRFIPHRQTLPGGNSGCRLLKEAAPSGNPHRAAQKLRLWPPSTVMLAPFTRLASARTQEDDDRGHLLRRAQPAQRVFLHRPCAGRPPDRAAARPRSRCRGCRCRRAPPS